ncbi:UbiD family decarboxylase domain-containing protein [Haloarcula sp. 1CSR25-25]|uniref:UbiD family decarboxylase domain-containing protein n=1 Tax=Haloarcula sp. 1CSR25-25 TaxID=2862545 RepID=UPI00289494A2|nr:UbiD family decarboxylase domain-containing protein [Haloarcula sp. 1CSR25-25]MDT3437734.1 UbiD family decarboxylase [Haloarcula sp. 1CSR25-25]
MTGTRSFRDSVDTLDTKDDLLTIEERIQSEDIGAVGAEALRSNGPAVRFAATDGIVTPVTGALAGPEQTTQSQQKPWERMAVAFGMQPDVPYQRVIERVAAPLAETTEPDQAELLAEQSDVNCYELGLPPGTPGEPPAFSLGLLAVDDGEETTWLPARGTVRGPNRLRAVVPAAAPLESGNGVTLSLGVPAAALTNTVLHWLDRTQTGSMRPSTRSDAVSVAQLAGQTVPADSEVLATGELADIGTGVLAGDESSMLEVAMDTAVVDIVVDSVHHRESPLVPFVPNSAPLTDDIHLVGITESARLRYRVNNYWGIEPAEWIRLPAEASLGMCVVASEILYAGFEWQLANTLFSFSKLFDKILILDEDTSAADLSRPLDDIWVKAHPSQDWVFSEPCAPAATAPRYRTDGSPGSRLFISATWDPRWDEEYIAPRVTYETSYPDAVRQTVTEMWDSFGFD